MKHESNRTSLAWSARFLALAIGLSSAGSLPVGRAQTLPALDPNFKPAITLGGGLVSAVAVQTDAKIVLAGVFNAINGIPRNGVARLNPDGSIDSAFDVSTVCCSVGLDRTSEASAPVSALAIQTDGKVLLGGSFTNVNGIARNGLARLNADGSLDTSFDPGTGLTPSGLSGGFLPVVKFVLQPDGKVLVGGYFTAVNGVARSGLARLNANGSVDTTFDPGTALAIGFPDFGPISGLALLPNGQVLVTGSFQAFADVKRTGIARLNANGSLDAFSPDMVQRDVPPSVDGLAVQSDGSIMISGGFYEVDGEFRDGLARLKPDGHIDPAFNPVVDTANGEAFRVLTLTADGKIIADRQITDSSGTTHRTIARVNSDGTYDPAWAVELGGGEGGRLQVLGAAVAPGGAVLIAGNLSSAADSTQQGVLRIGSSGQVDASFHPKFERAEGSGANVLTVAVQADNQVLLGGQFTRVNSVVRNGLARLSAAGTLDPAFSPVIQGDQPKVSASAIQPDGKILIGGAFATVNGASLNGVARLNADGSVDTSFNTGPGPQTADGAGSVRAMALQLDGKVLVAGSFTSFNGQPVPYLGRLNADGTVDTGFNSIVGLCPLCDPPELRALGVLSNGVVMVGGVLNRVDALPILARLNQDGSADASFSSPVLNTEQITALVVGLDDKTTVALTTAEQEGVAPKSRLLRFNSDGTLDGDFKPETVNGPSGTPVSALAIDTQGRTLIAGQFSSIGAAARRGLARLNPDGTLDATFDSGAGFASAVLLPAGRTDPLVTSLALGSDGGIVAGGNFASVNNQTRLGAARFQADQGVPTGGPARLSGITRAVDSGAVSMLVSGDAGRVYRIEASADLHSWAAAGTVTGAATPQPFSDTTAKGLPQRFYRAIGL